MKVETGRQAVWQHAKECGLDEGIARIAKYFDIKDVSIIGNGKLSYIDERPRKVHRVPAVPSIQFFREEREKEQAAKKAQKRR
uniref:Uncharacterized protein n=1 Tax=Salmonella phage PMBT35 TaxID=3137287 RepID=A0AAU8BWG0_9VIRU